MTMDYIKRNFKHWKDVKDNIQWINTIDLYLQKLKCGILEAINSQRLTKSGNYMKSLENSNQTLKAKVGNLVEQKQHYLNQLQSQSATINEQTNQLNFQTQQFQSEKQQNSTLRKEKRMLQIQTNRQHHQIVRLQKNQMLIPRSDLSDCVRPKEVEKYRIAQTL
eukprot:292525_1